MPFEQENAIALLYFDYHDTNVLIDEAERMATKFPIFLDKKT